MVYRVWLCEEQTYSQTEKIKHTFFDFDAGAIVMELWVSPGLGKFRTTDCPLLLFEKKTFFASSETSSKPTDFLLI